MLGGRVAIRSNVLKASNFGVTKCLCKSTTSDEDNQRLRKNPESPTPNKDGKANLSDLSRVSSNIEKILAPRRALKEINREITNGGEKGRFGSLDNLDQNKTKVIHEMLLIEDHHVEEMIRDSSGRVQDVVWCPTYVRPALKEPRGGDEISHHRCKSCQKISFHLLYDDAVDGKKYRPCLRCADWSENDIPSWYYHNGCDHCKLK